MYGAQTPFFWVLTNSGDRCLSAYRLVQEDLVRIARAVSEMSPLPTELQNRASEGRLRLCSSK